jgi:death-on-curing protein
VRYLSRTEIVALHELLIERFGGAAGIRESAALDSAIGQPLQTFDGEELYPSVIAKAAALGFFLCSNHPFVDGNKRVAHASVAVTLLLNGFEIAATIDDQETIMLRLASGDMSRAEFKEWLELHVRERGA